MWVKKCDCEKLLVSLYIIEYKPLKTVSNDTCQYMKEYNVFTIRFFTKAFTKVNKSI